MKNDIISQNILEETLQRPSWAEQESRLPNKLWLDKNECADSIFNEVVFNCLSSVKPESVFSYPNLDSLYKKIAYLSKVKSENILIAAGSDGAIRACFEICIQRGDKIILTCPTFAMYEVYSKIYGAKVTRLDYEVSNDGPQLGVEKFVSTIEEIKPKMVCLPNPDSPTGVVFLPSDIERIISAADQVGALILIDEAYHPLYQWTASTLINKYSNLIVVRSFSKAWGAAGIRVGYSIANDKLTSFLHKQRPMYEIGNVSAQAIEALLNHESDMLESVSRVREGQEYFQNEMKKIGFTTYKSHGNFFHIKFGKYANKVHEILDGEIYYRKDFNEPCLKGYSRLSATTKERFEPIIARIVNLVSPNN